MSRREGRPRFVVVLCVLTALTLITVDARANGGGVLHTVRSKVADVLGPVQRGVAHVTNPIGNFVDGAIHRDDLKAENARLQRENDQLRQRLLNQPEDARELAQLKAQLNLPYAQDLPKVAAQVIDAHPDNFAAAVIINRGTADGVAKGMPVVVATGLVGRVDSALEHRSVVRLINDPAMHVAVTLTQAGKDGITGGNGPSAPLTLSLVDKTAKPGQDELLVTSGLQGATYPKGIPVAKIVQASAKVTDDFLTATAVPTADLANLEFVDVLQVLPG